uniref:lysostaphin resistance A-like protein n=1 Tax=Cephaloticoccus sp. TaxID=1985742 RepID=UPI00404A6D6F
MPDTSFDALQPIIGLELLLVMMGGILFWQHCVSITGRTQAKASKAAMPAWEITLTHFFLFLWLVICGGLVLQGLTAALFKTSTLDETTALIINNGAFQGGMLLGVLVSKIFFTGKDERQVSSPSWLKIIKYSFVTFLIVLPLLTLVGLSWQYLMQTLGVQLEEQEMIAIFANTESPLQLGLMIILATVLAPVSEEMIFRAGIFRYLRTRVPRWVALVGPGILFAALHMNLASFAPLAVLGIIFSIAYERTGSIAVPIIAHGLFNLNTVVLILSGIGI